MTADVVTLGEALASFRSPGPLGFGVPVTPDLAGAETNVAIGLSRLGHRVAWVGRVGSDPFGEAVVRTLRGEGVGVEDVVVDGSAATGLMFLEQRAADLTRVHYVRAGSAGSRLGPDDLPLDAIRSARLLHVTGVTPALSPTAAEAVSRAVSVAREAGVRVSLDVNHRARLWSRDAAAPVLRALLPAVSLLVAGEDELGIVADGPEDEAVAGLLDSGVDAVAVKRGASGASLFTSDGRSDRGAVAVSAVDTVGAGDAFCAGLLSAVLDDRADGDALDRAVALGAWAVSTRGDWAGLPTRSELGDLTSLGPGETLR
ncbi:sugar kinase [Knoellia sp. CPCC 206450]|uniref:sugar kinase n=1 Tax=Knoellia tibetensis TaxID=3404798 RepID=UPI003B42E170